MRPPKETTNLVGTNIRKLRKLYNLTQKDLAEYIDADALQISRWERGEYIPDAYIIQRISSLFNIPTEILIRGIIVTDKNVNIESEEIRCQKIK